MSRRIEQIEQFIAHLGAALNTHDAVAYNRYFDEDISWGNPDGGIIKGVVPLHEVHKSFLEGPLHQSRFRYIIENVAKLTSDTAYVHVRLTRTNHDDTLIESDERCLYVLSQRQGIWWLCTGHNTRITSQPGAQIKRSSASKQS